MLAAHARAHAQLAELPLQLAWDGPAECGSVDEVRAELQRIARAKPGYALAPLTARVRVEPHAGGYQARLTTEHEGMSGERRLEAPDCPTLVRSLTLVLALAFGKGVEVGEPSADASVSGNAPPAPSTRSEQASTTQPAIPAEAAQQSGAPKAKAAAPEDDDTARAQDDAGDSGLRTALLLGAAVQLALLPDPAGSGVLGVELASGAWSVSLRAAAWPGSSLAVAPAVSARFDGLSGALQGCGQLPLPRVELALCAGSVAAALRGRSDGAFADGSDTAPWLALTATAAASWPARSTLQLRLEASLAASLSRPRFVIAGFGPVHRVPLLVPQLAALLVVTP